MEWGFSSLEPPPTAQGMRACMHACMQGGGEHMVPTLPLLHPPPQRGRMEEGGAHASLPPTWSRMLNTPSSSGLAPLNSTSAASVSMSGTARAATPHTEESVVDRWRRAVVPACRGRDERDAGRGAGKVDGRLSGRVGDRVR